MLRINLDKPKVWMTYSGGLYRIFDYLKLSPLIVFKSCESNIILFLEKKPGLKKTGNKIKL